MKLLTLKTDKVTIRPIDDSDTENIVFWRNQPFVLQNFIDKTKLTSEMHRDWLQKMIYTKKAYQFIIVENSSNLEIGTVFLRDVDLINKNAEFGIFIGCVEALGKGYGTHACKLITQFAFNELKIHKVFLRVLQSNLAATGAYEKAGFQKEAVFRKHIFKGCDYEDLIFMSKFNEG